MIKILSERDYKKIVGEKIKVDNLYDAKRELDAIGVGFDRQDKKVSKGLIVVEFKLSGSPVAKFVKVVPETGASTAVLEIF
jgi:hypothetical protein